MNEWVIVAIVVIAAGLLMAWALCRAAADLHDVDDGRAFGGDE